MQSNNLHGGWANEMPRSYVTQLSVRGLLAQKDKKLALSPLERTVLRAEACQQNGFEHLPIFGVALVRINCDACPHAYRAFFSFLGLWPSFPLRY